MLTEIEKRANRKALARKVPDLDAAHRRFVGRLRSRDAGGEAGPQLEVRALEAVALRATPDSIAIGYLAIVEVRRAS